MLIAFAALVFLIALEAAFPFGFFVSFGLPAAAALSLAALLEWPIVHTTMLSVGFGTVFYWIWRRRRTLSPRSEQGSFWRGQRGLAVTNIASRTGTMLLGATIWPARLQPASGITAIPAGEHVEVMDYRDGCLIVTPLETPVATW